MSGHATLIGLDITARCEALGIELERPARFHEREKAVRVPDDVGVGGSTVLAHHGGVGRPRIESAEQRLAGSVLKLPFRGADVAVAIGDFAVLDKEGVDHAVAGKPVVMAARLVLGVRPVAIEGAPEAGRKLARDFEVEIVLAAHRCEIA
jgi:hypothetical protein